jgi:hypothetical protein
MKDIELQMWLGQDASPELKRESELLVARETKERLRKDKSNGVDYGYSFPGMDRLKLSCLG